jgi:hypothetical protein|tara:strand:+ start:997 stop:1341 length:345 start_codon:yes stop_codon:yes gene_type:complete
MPVSNHIRSLLLQTIANNINEVIVGFDGTPASSEDGAAGRPARVLIPTVTIIDDTTLLVKATMGIDDTFIDKIREVYVQSRTATGFTPIARYTTKPFFKTTANEINIEILIEVA